MKKLLILIAMLLINTTAFAANPTCVLMKFTDDTRFESIESAESLSDLVMEKMINSGKFNLKATKPLGENMEMVIYDEKLRDLKGLITAFETKDFTPLFESLSFDEKRAQSIATAQVGQLVIPQMTATIGAAHNAEYLIQGTIINLGTGNWWHEDDFEKMSDNINATSELLGSSMPTSSLTSILSGIDVNKLGVGVQCDVRIIKAETGEVIWCKRVTGISEQTNLILGPVIIGGRKLNNNLYTKAMDKAAKKIVDAMIEDINANKLFN